MKNHSLLYRPGHSPAVITPRSRKFTAAELRSFLNDTPVIVDENADQMIMIAGARSIPLKTRLNDILKDNRPDFPVGTNLIICKHDLVADIFE